MVLSPPFSDNKTAEKLTVAFEEIVKEKNSTLDDILTYLIKTNELENIYFAEILFTYVQLYAISLQFQSTTKMPASNLAILLAQAFSGNSNNFETISLCTKFSKQILISNQCDQSSTFSEYAVNHFPTLFPLLIKARKNEVPKQEKEQKNVDTFLNRLKNIESKTKEEINQLSQSLHSINQNITQHQHDKSDTKLLKELQQQKESVEEKLSLAKLKLNNVQETLVSTQLMEQTVSESSTSTRGSINRLQKLSRESLSSVFDQPKPKSEKSVPKANLQLPELSKTNLFKPPLRSVISGTQNLDKESNQYKGPK